MKLRNEKQYHDAKSNIDSENDCERSKRKKPKNINCKYIIRFIKNHIRIAKTLKNVSCERMTLFEIYFESMRYDIAKAMILVDTADMLVNRIITIGITRYNYPVDYNETYKNLIILLYAIGDKRRVNFNDICNAQPAVDFMDTDEILKEANVLKSKCTLCS